MDAKEAKVGTYFTKPNKKRLPDAFEVVFNHIWLLSFPNCIPVKYIYTKLERVYFHRGCQICPQSLRPVTQYWRTRPDTRSPWTTVWMTFIIDYTSRRLHSHGAKLASSSRSSRTILDISRTYFSLVVIKSKVRQFFSNSSILRSMRRRRDMNWRTS